MATLSRDASAARLLLDLTEADVAKLNLVHRCESCTREFTKLRGLKMHMARWCDGGRTQRSRVGSLINYIKMKCTNCPWKMIKIKGTLMPVTHIGANPYQLPTLPSLPHSCGSHWPLPLRSLNPKIENA